MLKRLKHKWNVTTGRLILILVTFSLGGSLTGLAGRKLMSYMGIESNWLYIPIYIVVVTLVWPLMVLAVSIPFGQFNFFVHYLKRMFSRFRRRQVNRNLPPENETIESNQ